MCEKHRLNLAQIWAACDHGYLLESLRLSSHGGQGQEAVMPIPFPSGPPLSLTSACPQPSPSVSVLSGTPVPHLLPWGAPHQEVEDLRVPGPACLPSLPQRLGLHTGPQGQLSGVTQMVYADSPSGSA